MDFMWQFASLFKYSPTPQSFELIVVMRCTYPVSIILD
jgi:hypothetical protein